MPEKTQSYIEATDKYLKRAAKAILPSVVTSFINFYKSKKRIVKSFEEYKKHMLPGQYCFGQNFKYINLYNEEATKKAADMFDRKHLLVHNTRNNYLKEMIKKTIILFLSRELTVKYNGDISEFQGQIFLPCGIHKGFKIFDLINKKVLLTFAAKEEYEKIILDYNYFKDYFPQPRIIKTCDNSFKIIEEFIAFKPYYEWNKIDFTNIVNDVFNKTMNYFKDILDQENYFLKSPAELMENMNKVEPLLENIKNGIREEVRKTKFPYIKLHGDLWTSNLLINENDGSLKYIDFEHSDDFVFFYDIFLLIWTDFYLNKNNIFVNELMCGNYDFYFESIFSLFKMEFKKEYRLDYINIFFLEYYKARWLSASETGLIKTHELYKEFMSYKPDSDYTNKNLSEKEMESTAGKAEC